MIEKEKIVKTEYAIFYHKESVIESLLKDIITLLTLSFLIGISLWGNTIFWTFVTGGMFVLWISGRIRAQLKEGNRFKTKKALQAWVDSIEE